MMATLRNARAAGLTLLGFAVLGAALLAGTFTLTRDTIENTERATRLKLVAQTLPPGSFDNDLVRDARPLALDPLLGLRFPAEYYVARRAGEATAVVLDVVAPDGYAGEIRMLVGILADGRVAGVRVTSHRETPGLGDYIEIGRGDWIRQFEGKSLGQPPIPGWKVRKDGGVFDYMAGATITPRAVVKAVRHALDYFARHKSELLAPATEAK